MPGYSSVAAVSATRELPSGTFSMLFQWIWKLSPVNSDHSVVFS